MRIRFDVTFREHKAPKDPGIPELKRWCALFHRLGLAPPFAGASLGNLSFRLKNGSPSFIITASETGMKDGLPDDAFVIVYECDPKRGIVCAEGTKNPSSESMLHSCIYTKRPDVNAIFHGHSELILSAAEKLSIPTTTREDPYGSLDLIESVSEILDDLMFFILRGHGFMALGKTMRDAGKQTVDVYRKSQGFGNGVAKTVYQE